MHYWLTENGALHCLHPGAGNVDMARGADFVHINGARVHIQPNPLARSIGGCKHPGSTNSKPCTSTLTVNSGYSTFVRIGGHPVCLATVTGVTDSVPPSSYRVSYPGQAMVRGT